MSVVPKMTCQNSWIRKESKELV